MVRVDLKGVHRVAYRLKSTGEVKEYFYAWRGGPALEGRPGSPEFVRSYQKAHAERDRPKTEAPVVKSLIQSFRASPEFRQKIGDYSRREYDRYLAKIDDAFGDMPLEALSDPEVRGIFKDWRDRWADRPRAADYAWTTLARLFAWAKDRGRIPVNPCERGGRLYESDRSEIVWTEGDIARFMATAPEHLRFALLLGLWTGQRIGDLRILPWSAYDGRFIRLKQSKTGRSVSIKVGAPLKAALDARPRVATTILTTSESRTWTHYGFQASWRKAVAKAGLDLHFHDLRGSAVTRLAEAGCTEAEIAAITGHSMKDVGIMLDRYLHRTEKLAEAAIVKLERRTKKVSSS